jgi:hypothetical protein
VTDLEITKLCAEAMGCGVVERESDGAELVIHGDFISPLSSYDPLHDDAQAMALVKKFWMVIDPPLRDSRAPHKVWRANIPDADTNYSIFSGNLNRAICECVAKMQAAK